ncbi:proteinase [Wenjunlia vitaminophila]|uniref:Proteinase n=1 Tax=Wenjunlia vitaminophila TaxID=76728 RepID=A0A0T6LNP0_WENVI|nr:alpha/beta hydrolase [Wenjunlia vitaminophila]KRV47588.1 proteinase [Wenjunlia vitaminophila]
MPTVHALRSLATWTSAAIVVLSACSLTSAEEAASPARDAGSPSASGLPDSAKSPRSPKPGTSATLAPLPSTTDPELRPYYQQELNWRACGASGFECTTMRVPLDYDNPRRGDDVKLAVARKRAESTADRIGSLLVNPGGPGGSAIDYLQQQAALGYPAPVRARYDMVAFDPRGVKRSQPVTCLSDLRMDAFTRVDITPDDQGEIDKLVDANKAFARGCAQNSGKLLPHMGTIEAARDMDVLRALVGDDKLHYDGLSYGTMLGATYAGLFPDRVGRLVLDGAMDPSISALESSRAQAGGFETAFTAFASDCVKREDCPLGTSSVNAAGRNLDEFFKDLDRKPLPTQDGSRTLDEPLATTGVLLAMYDEGYWPVLRQALAAAKKGDGTRLLRMSDVYYEREGGVYSNIMYANAAVNCLDLPPAARTPDDVKRALPSFTDTSPRFGTSMAWASLICGSWPVKPQGTPHRIEAKGADPILVVGTTRDPATPYTWAQSLAGQLDSATLLTYEGDGHTAYGRGSACVDSVVNDYLLNGRVPATDKRCT